MKYIFSIHQAIPGFGIMVFLPPLNAPKGTDNEAWKEFFKEVEKQKTLTEYLDHLSAWGGCTSNDFTRYRMWEMPCGELGEIRSTLAVMALEDAGFVRGEVFE